MRKFLLGAFASAAIAAPGLAADLPATTYTKSPMVAEVWDWTGFYIGLQGGFGWGTSQETFFNQPNTAGLFAGTQNYDFSGGIAGGVVGFNWQSGAWVFGVEADYNWSNLNGNSREINAGLGDTYFTNVKSLGDVKGRVGWTTNAWDTTGNRMLVYVDGGVAFGQVEHHYDAGLNGGAANTFIATASRTGWTAGVGLEYMFTRNFTGRLEFDWVDLGRSTIQYDPTVITNRSEWRDSFGVVKVGVNYKFGGPVVAKY